MQRDPKLIGLEIDRTRHDIATTLEELADKLDLEKTVEHAVDVVIEHAKAAASDAVHDVRVAVVHTAADAKASVVGAATHAKTSVQHAGVAVIDGLVALYYRSRRLVRDNPGLVAAAAGGAVVAIAIAMFIKRRD